LFSIRRAAWRSSSAGAKRRERSLPVHERQKGGRVESNTSIKRKGRKPRQREGRFTDAVIETAPHGKNATIRRRATARTLDQELFGERNFQRCGTASESARLLDGRSKLEKRKANSDSSRQRPTSRRRRHLDPTADWSRDGPPNRWTQGSSTQTGKGLSLERDPAG